MKKCKIYGFVFFAFSLSCLSGLSFAQETEQKPAGETSPNSPASPSAPATQDAKKVLPEEETKPVVVAPSAFELSLQGKLALHGAIGLGGGKGKYPENKKDLASARIGLRYTLSDVNAEDSSILFGFNYGSHTGIHKTFDTNHAMQQFVLTSGLWFRPMDGVKEFSAQTWGGIGMWRKTGRYQDLVQTTKVDSGPLFELGVDGFYEVLPKVQVLGGIAANLSKESWFQALVGMQANL
jgi:hypothetical protein